MITFRRRRFLAVSVPFLLLFGLPNAPLLAQQAPYDVFPSADPPYYRVRYEASKKPGELVYGVNYTIWVPRGVKTLRGVIVHQHGCGEGSCKSGLTGAYDLHWQALAKKHDCALLAPAYEQPEKADCQMWCDPRNGSSAAFQKALADLGATSGHPELAEVPWALWGHSGGGHWAGGMVLVHPERVAAAWLRSGVPQLKPNPERPTIKAHAVPVASLKVPMMCNLGTKEGVTVKDNQFKEVWPANEAFFNEVRGKGGLIGVAVDPLTSHECGNQRYLAIPWFDACLTARLPKRPGAPLNPMPADDIWLAFPTGFEAQPAAKFSGDSLKAGWLPDAAIARLWMQYVKDTNVTDTTAPPAPTDLRIDGNTLRWQCEADLESGLAGFLIERDGTLLAKFPESPRNPFGRPLFQNLQYSDTPTQPLVSMRFTDTTAKPDAGHSYRVIALNSVGLKSEPSGASGVNQKSQALALPKPGARGNADNVPYIGRSDPKGNPVRLAKASGHVSNYREDKVRPYTLPDPLVLANGERVKDAEEWVQKRRPEILKFYREEIYGRVPENAPKVTWEIAQTDPTARNGSAIMTRVTGRMGEKADGPKFNLTLHRPANATGPVPVMLNITFGFPPGGGRPAMAGKGQEAPPKGKNEPAKKAPAKGRGPAFVDPVAETLGRGWAHASLNYSEIQPDRPDRWTEGVIGLTLKPGQLRPAPDEWGTISAWAWGVSRAIDYLELNREVDAKRIAITGTSRLGKTVLWAAAQDDRVAAVFSVVPGEMGASLIRRDWGETLDDMAQNFGYQFAGNLQKWVGRWDELPVDQHMLIALCAPRPVYVNGGLTDQWSDPKGEFLAMVAAGPVYRLLCAKDLGTTELPPLDRPVTGGDLAFHYHSGGHMAVPADWNAFFNLAERHFQQRQNR